MDPLIRKFKVVTGTVQGQFKTYKIRTIEENKAYKDLHVMRDKSFLRSHFFLSIMFYN